MTEERCKTLMTIVAGIIARVSPARSAPTSSATCSRRSAPTASATGPTNTGVWPNTKDREALGRIRQLLTAWDICQKEPTPRGLQVASRLDQRSRLALGSSRHGHDRRRARDAKLNTYRAGPDDQGFFGLFGGRYVAETLMPLILELDRAYEAAKADPAFQQELTRLNTHYAGRPSPLYFAERLTSIS